MIYTAAFGPTSVVLSIFNEIKNISVNQEASNLFVKLYEVTATMIGNRVINSGMTSFRIVTKLHALNNFSNHLAIFSSLQRFKLEKRYILQSLVTRYNMITKKDLPKGIIVHVSIEKYR